MTTPLHADRREPMKVLHIISNLHRGGAETVLFRQITASRVDVSHHVVSLTDEGAYGRPLQELGIPVDCLGMKGPLDMLAVGRRLLAIIRSVRPDIVHTWMYHADFLGGLAARRAGVPVVWCIHSVDLKRGSTRSTRVLQRVCALLSRTLPRRIVCVAEAARAAHVAVGYDARRMVVVPNGYDIARFHDRADAALELRHRLGIAPDDLVVGCVGRFDPAKDYRGFTRACAELGAAFPKLRLLIVGPRVTPENEVLRDWIAETGIANRFVLVGEQDDVALHLAAMDVFCLPSRTEAFPNVVVEAMLMARSCVVTDVGDVAAMTGDTGVVVPPEDPAQLAAGLAQVLRLPATARLLMGARARERARAHYSMEIMLDRIGDVYRTAIESCRKPG